MTKSWQFWEQKTIRNDLDSLQNYAWATVASFRSKCKCWPSRHKSSHPVINKLVLSRNVARYALVTSSSAFSSLASFAVELVCKKSFVISWILSNKAKKFWQNSSRAQQLSVWLSVSCSRLRNSRKLKGDKKGLFFSLQNLNFFFGGMIFSS